MSERTDERMAHALSNYVPCERNAGLRCMAAGIDTVNSVRGGISRCDNVPLKLSNLSLGSNDVDSVFHSAYLEGVY